MSTEASPAPATTAPAPASSAGPSPVSNLPTQPNETQIADFAKQDILKAVESGKLSPQKADEYLKQMGAGTVADNVADQAKARTDAAKLEGDPTALPGFESAAKISDYTLPDVSEMNKIVTADINGQPGAGLSTKEVMEINDRVGGWLHAGEIPAAIGSAIGNMAKDHIQQMPRYDAMTAGAKEAYRIVERSRLDKLFGDQAPANIALASQLVREIEAKRPGLVAFLETTGLGNNHRVVAQLANQARRMAARAG